MCEKTQCKICSGTVEDVGDSLSVAKQNFLLLCEQYNQLGIFFQIAANKDTSRLTKAITKRRILEQYQAMGNQLKILGSALDGMGGKSILNNDPDGTKEEPQQ